MNKIIKRSLLEQIRVQLYIFITVSGRTSIVFTGRTTCRWCRAYRGMQRGGAQSLGSIGRFQALERTAVGMGLTASIQTRCDKNLE